VAVDDLTTNFPRVDVVKIDVEGAEFEVLRGMQSGLARERYRAILLELHPGLLRQQHASGDACVQLLSDAGYRGWTIDQSPRVYSRAAGAHVPAQELLRPLDEWVHQSWPHLFWLAPGEEVI
jgi:hypothetical protein